MLMTILTLIVLFIVIVFIIEKKFIILKLFSSYYYIKLIFKYFLYLIPILSLYIKQDTLLKILDNKVIQ